MEASRDLLRVLTCGSVDDGKSSLIGRLLYDAGLVPSDHLEQLKRDSRNRTAGPEGLDLSLLLDGLEAEREQGITIDVAYRYFSTCRRAFIVADAPGHEQYTRNMVTGASTAQLALVLVDARKGISDQTSRHSLIAGLLGIRDVVVVVNKMDLVDWSPLVFQDIEQAYTRMAERSGIERVTAIPLSALTGDNVVRSSANMKWFSGPTLLDHLETVTVPQPELSGPLRLPVQWVNRPSSDFRGFAGTIARGILEVGETVAVARTNACSKVERIIAPDGDRARAHAGEAVTVVLANEVDVSRGDVLTAPDSRPQVADLFQARLVWLTDEPMLPGRSYLMRLGTQQVPSSITDLKFRIDPNTFEKLATKTLEANEIGLVHVATDKAITFEPYTQSRALGGFVLIDRLSNATVGAGMIDFPLHRASNVPWQNFEVTRARRSELKGQRPVIIWLTGLSGAGKSTVANIVDRKLTMAGRHTSVLDGDNIRHGLSRDLGFTEHDRVENIRRAAHVARLMADAGLIVLVSLISPFRHERALAREIAGDLPFVEVFVDAPIEVCEARDVKGLYQKARRGEVRNFTGISSPYEPPERPDLHLRTDRGEPEGLAEMILNLLSERRFV